MALYEHVFLARQDMSSQQVEGLVDTFKAVLEEGEGSVKKVEHWGIKTLAFRIRKNRKAHYVLMNIDASHAAVAEMERQMRLNEDVLRHMTIRVDEHDEGQSAMLQKRDRDDRPGGRGGRGDRGDRGERGDRGDRPPRDRDRGPRREARESAE